MRLPKRISPLLPLFFAIVAAAGWSFSTLKPQYTTSEPALDIWALNVGQGESVLVREPSGKKILFDGGPSDAVLSELGAILPAWDRTIDLVILSHNHSDHVQGFVDVLQRYDVKEAWINGALQTTDDYLAFLQELKDKHVPTKITYSTLKDPASCTTICPQPLAFGSTTLQVYHPLENMSGKKVADQHDATISVKVTFETKSLFLTGDLNEDHEQDMIDACKAPACTLQSDILQVPHHGSKTGLSPAFLAAVSPKAAFIPVGLNNKFGHPGADILTKLSRAGVPIYRTDTQGRVHLILTKDSLRISTENP